MQCVVLGITPPTKELVEPIQQHVTRLDDVGCDNENLENHHHQHDDDNDDDGRLIRWRPQYTLALDTTEVDEENKDTTKDDHTAKGIPTLLLSAMFEGDAACLEAAVQGFVGPEHQVQIWATAGAPLPLRPLEGYETHIVLPATTNTDVLTQARRAMQEFGMVVQPRLFSQNVVQEFRAIVDQAIERVEASLAQHRPELVVGTDVLSFREIASRNSNRFDLRLDLEDKVSPGTPPTVALVRQLLKESLHMQEFLRHAMDLREGNDNDSGDCDIFDGLDFDVSVVYSRPGAGAQGWHADGSHRPGAADAAWQDDGKVQRLTTPYAICLFVPLIDLNDEVGYTQFWPGSHAHCQLVGLGPFAQVTQSVWNSDGCLAGDGVWYDYRLMHQGMHHEKNSSVPLRPIVQIIFKQKWYVERANYGVESIVATERQSL